MVGDLPLKGRDLGIASHINVNSLKFEIGGNISERQGCERMWRFFVCLLVFGIVGFF